MARRRESGKARLMRPAILVVCEGETEETYVDFLRRQYRCPIKIVSKILGADINERRIEAIQDSMKVSGNDIIHTFLMYDRDVAATNTKLDHLQGVKLCSNPCIEFWFLLHAATVSSPLTSSRCVEQLRKANGIWSNYEKAILTLRQREFLWNNRMTASSRSKRQPIGKNPSSTVFKLLDYLEENRR